MANPSSISAALSKIAGKLPDGEVANQLGIPLQTVKDYRKAANVPAFKRTPVAPAVAEVPVAPSGKAQAGATVIRRREGTPKVQLRAPVPPAVDAQVAKPAPVQAKSAQPNAGRSASGSAHPLDKYRDRMGNEPDDTIAAEAGVHRTSVGQYRRDHGLKAYRGHYEGKGKAARAVTVKPVAAVEVVAPPAKPEAAVAAPKPSRAKRAAAPVAAPVVVPVPAPAAVEAPVARKANKLAGFEPLIGIESDSVVARKANCSPRLVRMYREKHGIAAPVRAVKAASPAKVEVSVAPAAAVETPAAAPVAAPAKAKRTPKAAKTVEAAVEVVAAPAAAARKSRKAPAAKTPDPVDSESAVSEAAVVAETPAVAAPVETTARKAAKAAPAPVQQGFRVVAVADGVSHRFLAIGADIGAAAARAYQALETRPGGPWRIVKIVAGDEVVG